MGFAAHCEDNMNKKIKKIGVLTSGGDAPGMNAAIRGVTLAASREGVVTIGIQKGYEGLLHERFCPLSEEDVATILDRGGTFLRTARSPEFATPEGVRKAAANAAKAGLDAIVIIGGDGSFRGARDLSAAGIPVIGIPGTIDNDIGCTDYTIGFDTAMNTAMDAIDRIHDTAYSHERCSIAEVMGRHAGYIAYYTAVACGADIMLLPEDTVDFDRDVIAPLCAAREAGKREFLIVAAEGVEGLNLLPGKIEKEFGIKPTYSVLGYIQRGGSPTLRDRATASLMGERAVSCLLNGEEDRIIAVRNGEICALPLGEALTMKKTLPASAIRAGKNLSRQ